MVKILVTGKSSYISNSFKNYIENNFNNDYIVDIISVNNIDLSSISFKGYDVLFHCAGIAHSDSGHISSEKAKLYYKYNTDLTKTLIEKAYDDGIKHFIYMSSIIVYGNPAPIGKKKVITKSTKPSPINAYGDSKLKAENAIIEFSRKNNIIVSIVRSPMVYGNGCKGNYKFLEKVAKVISVFPDFNSERSAISIDNLCLFIKKIVEKGVNGIFFPQDDEYMNVSRTVCEIAKKNGKKIHLTKFFNTFIILLSKFIPIINRAFGSIIYAR